MLHDAVRVAHVTKRFGRLLALDDVAFTMRPGEVLGLIGPNGSGKTTLLECLAGVLPPDAGTLSIGGVPITPADRSRQLFYLPDAIAPWPAQPLGWALDFAVNFFGSVGVPALTRDEVVRKLDLSTLLTSPIGALSKGQRKRALLGIALLMPHAVLLLDEPFDGLDLRQSRDVALVLRAHALTGRTMFLSIHQISEAARVCDRFVLLSGGRVRGEGTLDELAGHTSRNLEEVFLALT